MASPRSRVQKKFLREYSYVRILFLGGELTFADFKELQEAFKSLEVHPSDLKEAVELYINRLLDPIRKEFAADPKLQSLAAKAYAPVPKESA